MSALADELREIAKWHFTEAIDILASIEIIEHGNNPWVIAKLQRSPAGHVAELIRRSIFATLTVRVARVYARTQANDRHLARAFELLGDASVRAEIERTGRKRRLSEAVAHWTVCKNDPQLKLIQHVRNKRVAHLGTVSQSPPQIGPFLNFCRETTHVMELLAQATRIVSLGLDSQMGEWKSRAAAFWRPWELVGPLREPEG